MAHRKTKRDKFNDQYQAFTRQIVTEDVKRYILLTTRYHFNRAERWESIAAVIFALYTSILIIIIYQGLK